MEVAVSGQPIDKKEKKKPYGKYEEYEIKDAVRTLMEAEEIKADKEKMKYVRMCIAKKKKAINSIDDLRSKIDELMEKDND